MKILPLFLISIILVLGCTNSNISQNTDRQTNDNNVSSASKYYKLGVIDKDMIIETMQIFRDVDMEKVKTIMNIQGDLFPDNDETQQEETDRWYLDNIQHIDSLTKFVIFLANQEKYEEIGILLDPELINFYGHPNSDTYSVYQLHWAMLPLYKLIIPDDDKYYEKLIEMWEMNRLMIESVQLLSGEDHPLYGRVLAELSGLYEKAGEDEKKKEVDSVLAVFN